MMHEFPEWAVRETKVQKNGKREPPIVLWIIDEHGRIWATDHAMICWMQDGLADWDYAPNEAVAARMLAATKVRAERFVDIGEPILIGEHAAICPGNGAYDVRRVLLLEEAFPEPARWGVGTWRDFRGDDHPVLIRCDPEGNAVAVVQRLVL